MGLCDLHKTTSQTLSESLVSSVRPCQNPLYHQSDPVTISCIISQTLSQSRVSPIWPCQNPLYHQSYCQNPLYHQSDPVRIPCIISQTVRIPCITNLTLSQSPVSSVTVRIPCITNLTLSQSPVSSFTVRIPCIISQTLSESPVSPIWPCQNPLLCPIQTSYWKVCKFETEISTLIWSQEYLYLHGDRNVSSKPANLNAEMLTLI